MNPRDVYNAAPRWLRVVLGEILVVGIPVAAILLSHPTPFAFAEEAALIACAALPLRLRWPWLAMPICLPALAGTLGWPPALVALYRIGRHNHRVGVVVAWVVVAVASGAVPLQFKLAMPWQDRVMSVVFSVVSLMAPAALGALVRVRRELTASLVELRRAREAELEARLDGARSAERARIAREIHDSVGHHSTLIAVQSSALAATTEDPATKEAALRLRVLAKESLAEMRAALGLLNERRPLGLADLPSLLTRVCRAGLRIEFDGDVIEDTTSPLVGRAVYRVVQEALTNVTKHAPASAVKVRLVRDGDRIFVSVLNTQPTRTAAPPDGAYGGGAGLEGLAERVRHAGGTLRTETLPDGGFSVLAELPLEGPPSTKVGSSHSTSGGTADQMAQS